MISLVIQKIDTNQGNQIRFKIPMLQSEFDYTDEYIVVKETVTVRRANNEAYDKKLAFENNKPFIFCIRKISNTLLDNADLDKIDKIDRQDLDDVMSMHNLTEQDKNYSQHLGSLWNYFRIN